MVFGWQYKKWKKYKRCLANNIGTSRRLGPPAVSLLRPILLSLNQAPPRLPTALLSREEPWQDQVLHSRRVVVLDSRRVVVCVRGGRGWGEAWKPRSIHHCISLASMFSLYLTLACSGFYFGLHQVLPSTRLGHEYKLSLNRLHTSIVWVQFSRYL